MLIECPFCKATAKLPEEKEGAKVRCSGCGKVYVAREKGSKAKTGGVNGITIGIGAGAVILIGLFVESVIFRSIENATIKRWGMQS